MIKFGFLPAGIGVLAVLLANTPAEAQAPQEAPPPAPSAEALSLAHTMIKALGQDGPATMNGMMLPISDILKQIGVSGPEQGKAVYREAIMPVLMNHPDVFSDIQAQSYATVLSVDDMKAIIAFYQTPAGKDLVRARSRVFQADSAAVANYLPSLMPEMQAKAAEVFKAHGWTRK